MGLYYKSTGLRAQYDTRQGKVTYSISGGSLAIPVYIL